MRRRCSLSLDAAYVVGLKEGRQEADLSDITHKTGALEGEDERPTTWESVETLRADLVSLEAGKQRPTFFGSQAGGTSQTGRDRISQLSPASEEPM
jgi:hypothetical protein